MRERAPLRLGSRSSPWSRVVLLVLPACNQAEKIREQAIADSQAVTFESVDGVPLAGRLFGPDTATAGVVLAHMQPADQSSWFDVADQLGEHGYRALTFDFRGYCPGGDAGCSEGEKDTAAIWQDVAGAVGFLRTAGRPPDRAGGREHGRHRLARLRLAERIGDRRGRDAVGARRDRRARRRPRGARRASTPRSCSSQGTSTGTRPRRPRRSTTSRSSPSAWRSSRRPTTAPTSSRATRARTSAPSSRTGSSSTCRSHEPADRLPHGLRPCRRVRRRVPRGDAPDRAGRHGSSTSRTRSRART